MMLTISVTEDIRVPTTSVYDDYLLVFAFFFHRVIVAVEDGDNVFLALKFFG